MDAKKVHSLGVHLRRTVPLLLPVSIRLVRRLADRGDCNEVAGRYLIRVRRELDTNEGFGTLLHEFAHAAAYGLDGEEDHGEFFQEARGVVFGAYLDWLKRER
jgi:hypothetical protein